MSVYLFILFFLEWVASFIGCLECHVDVEKLEGCAFSTCESYDYECNQMVQIVYMGVFFLLSNYVNNPYWD